MGVVNVTDDSFSDGGRYLDPTRAVQHGLTLAAVGAGIIDVGGESTRPGAVRIETDAEIARIVPVVKELAAQGLTVSIDTMHAAVAHAALDNGARIVNDVSGGLADVEMLPLVARLGVGYIAMHWRGHSADMQSRAVYDDVVVDVARELAERRETLLDAGIRSDRLILDPGLGFAKTGDHNWQLLRGLDTIVGLGQPVLLGASRKGFLARVGRAAGAERTPKERDVATAVTSLYAAHHGAWGVRVHDVVGTIDAFDVADELAEEG